jgi:predicted membrane channel-forming protein YqfA (hemolysin III family)
MVIPKFFKQFGVVIIIWLVWFIILYGIFFVLLQSKNFSQFSTVLFVGAVVSAYLYFSYDEKKW